MKMYKLFECTNGIKTNTNSYLLLNGEFMAYFIRHTMEWNKINKLAEIKTLMVLCAGKITPKRRNHSLSFVKINRNEFMSQNLNIKYQLFVLSDFITLVGNQIQYFSLICIHSPWTEKCGDYFIQIMNQ